MKAFFLFIILVTSMPMAFAQKAFLKACTTPKSQLDSVKNDILWFKYFYKTNDCQKIAAELSKLTSLAQIVQPWIVNQPELQSSWMYSFPKIYGDSVVSATFDDWQFHHDIRKKIFLELDLYSDFPNITSLNYTRVSLPYPMELCEVIKAFPNLKTVATEFEFLNKETDRCLEERNIEVILTQRIKSIGSEVFTSNIIGIEQYMGDLTELLQFNNLKYLGVSDSIIVDRDYDESHDKIKPIALATLGGLPNLTHLTLASSNISNIQDLKYSYNLTWLTLSCALSEYDLDKSPCTVNAPFLKNLDFLSNLRWLEYLDLSYNMLQAFPDFAKLTKLKSLILRGNSILSLPWKKAHSSLDYLDLSGNKISSIDEVSQLTNLTFLNLSGNQIKRFDAIEKLQKLKFLNLSNNIYQKDLSTLNPAPSLKVLSLNGGCSSEEVYDFFQTQFIVDTNQKDASNYSDAIYGDFALPVFFEARNEDGSDASPVDPAYWDNQKKNVCKNKEMVAPDANFEKFKNLEALSLRYNKFFELPNLSSLKNLKFLNMEGNKVKTLTPTKLPESLIVLAAPLNSIDELPNLTAYPSLQKVNLSGNNIKSVKNLKLLSPNMTLNLSGNLIKDIKIFDKAKFRETSPTLYGNPIDPKKCPIHSKNVELAYYCRGANNGYSNGELDSIGFSGSMILFQNHFFQSAETLHLVQSLTPQRSLSEVSF